VGWALRALDRDDVPWHRVVGHDGRISLRFGGGPAQQLKRLRAEGIRFERGRVDMKGYRYRP
jgi:alkylated DNA nucleotide flippase Atl1